MNEVQLTVEKPIRTEDPRILPYQQSSFPTLRWAAAHYGWVVLLAAIVGGLLAARVPAVTAGTTHEAAALVTARDLVIDPEQLPQTAAAIFNAGEVAQQAVELSGVDVDPIALIPDVVRLEPVENTVVLRVVASDADPERAAVLANGTAQALVVELSRLGAGVGRFSLHTPAAVPQAPVEGPPLPPTLIGLIAGALFGLGILGLWIAARKPVIDPDTLRVVLDVPITGSLALSSLDATGDLRQVPHLAPVAATLFPKGDERRFLVAVKVRRRTLRLLGMVLARTLARSGKAALVGTGVTRQPFGTDQERDSLLVDEYEAPTPGIPTVVLGRFLPDDTEPLDDQDGCVLIIGKGASLHEIRRAVVDLEELSLVGIIFLRPLGFRDIARRQNPELA